MKWERTGSRVHGQGQSYNCTNTVTAETLQNTLNNYEKQLQQYKNLQKQYEEINEKLDQIAREITKIRMTTAILSDEIQTLQGMI